MRISYRKLNQCLLLLLTTTGLIACAPEMTSFSNDSLDAESTSHDQTIKELESEGPTDVIQNCDIRQIKRVENRIRWKLNNSAQNSPLTIKLSSKDGRTFLHSIGSSTENSKYHSASTSKWLTATAILILVDRKRLSLETRVSEVINFWPKSDSNLSKITLRHLLSFTSGLNIEPACINNPTANFEECVKKIMIKNRAANIAPSTQYYYGATHMQVAGLMAMKATGYRSWNDLFRSLRSYMKMPKTIYNKPSEKNPRLAGGATWTAREYFNFLNAFKHNQILSVTSRLEQSVPQFVNAKIIKSPPKEELDEDWFYGLGIWIEDPDGKNPKSYTISSAGAFGSYPFINNRTGLSGIIAMEEHLGAFSDLTYDIYKSIQDDIYQWSNFRCLK